MLEGLMRVWEERGKEVMYEAEEVKSEILTALWVFFLDLLFFFFC